MERDEEAEKEPAAQAPSLLMQGEEVHEPAIALMEREEEAEKEQECLCAHCNVTLGS